jgi:2-polyprenyl-3-methyl-5-hydroxy-6-metoxy-1,4-benzoquinol methylase
MSVNEQKLEEFLGKAVVDLGATFHAASVVIGEKLGLYKALAQGGPMTSEELAKKTETHERYVREWLNGQAAGGYVTYKDRKYSLSPEQAMCMADETSPTYLPGGFQVAVSALRAEPKIFEKFRSGGGLGWHEHDAGLFEGTEKFFRPNYAANLVSNWIPALDGVEAKLRAGAHVADVGCGLGASTILMAKAFPKSTFAGFDYHEASVQKARESATRAGVGDRTSFKVSTADAYPGTYDFAAFFDCLHDMGDPKKVATHVKRSLKSDGTWMLVEPFAHDDLEKNFNPIGRVFYTVSTLVCTPASLSQEGRMALGAQAGEARLREVAQAGGFTRFRRAAETPFNLVLEARP